METLSLIPLTVLALFAAGSLVADHYRKKYATVTSFGFYS